MSKSTLKRYMKALDRNGLEEWLYSMYEGSVAFRQAVDMNISETEADKIEKKYCRRLEKIFFPSDIGRMGFSLKEAKNILKEYTELCVDNSRTARMKLYFAEYCCEFTNTYGDINTSFYNALEKAFMEALEYAGQDKDFYDCFSDDLERVVNDCSNFGWGVYANVHPHYIRLCKKMENE